MAKLQTIRGAARLNFGKLIDANFQMGLAVALKSKEALVQLGAFIQQATPALEDALSVSIADVIRKEMKNRLELRRTGAFPISQATMELTGLLSKLPRGPWKFEGATTRVRSPLVRRAFGEEMGRSLVDSIDIVELGRNPSGSRRLMVGISGNIQHPQNGESMARIAFMHENGYGVRITKKMKKLFTAAAAASGQPTEQRRGQGLGEILVPSRPFLQPALNFIMTDPRQSKVVENIVHASALEVTLKHLGKDVATLTDLAIRAQDNPWIALSIQVQRHEAQLKQARVAVTKAMKAGAKQATASGIGRMEVRTRTVPLGMIARSNRIRSTRV
jgi:hypothetical protein